MMHIVLTGTESTFKSSLAAAIAEEFNIPLLEEYARLYLDGQTEPIELQPMDRKHYDLIERGQIQAQKAMGYFEKGQSVVFDTDGVVLYLWKKDKYGEVDAALLDVPKHIVYLFCRANVEAIEDALRVDGHRRVELDQKYQEVLQDLDNTIVELDAPTFEERKEQAIESLHALGFTRYD